MYHFASEVEIVGGDADEGWAVVEYLDDDDRQDVLVSELNAGNGTHEIFGRLIELDNPMMEYDEHLPLDVQPQNKSVTIRTNNGEILYESDFYQTARKASDSFDVADEADEASLCMWMAYENPKRFLYRNQDQLLTMEA